MKITPELIDQLMEAMCAVFALPAHITSEGQVDTFRAQWHAALDEYEEEDVRATWRYLRVNLTRFPFPAEFIAALSKCREGKHAATSLAQ